MKRVEFIKTLPALLISGWGLVWGRKNASSVSKTYLLNRFYVAGFFYYQGKDVLSSIRNGDELILIPQPENIHDKYAIEVYWKQTKLGYIPRAENKHLAWLLEQGAQLHCEVVETCTEEFTWQEVEAEVWLNSSNNIGQKPKFKNELLVKEPVNYAEIIRMLRPLLGY